MKKKGKPFRTIFSNNWNMTILQKKEKRIEEIKKKTERVHEKRESVVIMIVSLLP